MHHVFMVMPADSEEETDLEELEESEDEEIFKTPTRRAAPRPPATSSRDRIQEYLTRKKNPSAKTPTARSTVNSRKKKLTYEEAGDDRARSAVQDPKIAILEAQIAQLTTLMHAQYAAAAQPKEGLCAVIARCLRF